MSVLLTRSVWLLYLGVQQCSYLFPKWCSTSLQVMEARLRCAYTKHFFGGPFMKRIASIDSIVSFLSNFTFIFSWFLSFVKSFLFSLFFFLKANPCFTFHFPPSSPPLLWWLLLSPPVVPEGAGSSQCHYFPSPASCWLCEFASLSVSQPGLPICFHSNEVVEKKEEKKNVDEKKREEEEREGMKKMRVKEWSRERERIGKGDERKGGTYEKAVRASLKKTFQ